jgi:uncharacterized coiled-coil protein SlyX
MTTENKPESQKEGEEKIYIDGDFNNGYEASIQRSKGKGKKHKQVKKEAVNLTVVVNKPSQDELQSLRDQLAEKERDRAIYANVVNYLNAQLAAKEETFNKMRSEFHAMNKRLMDDIVAKNTVIEAKEEEVTHWKGGYEAANETIKSLLDGFQVVENPDFPDDMMMVSTAIYKQLKSITPNP